jgi:TonB family protein
MRLQKFGVSSSGFRFGPVLVLCLASALASAAVASGQKDDEKEKRIVVQHGSSVEILNYTPLPEATEACRPAECEWWQRVREAGDQLQKKRDNKAAKAFFLLLYEGQQKSYRIPLKDRPPQALLVATPAYSEWARRQGIEGTVELSVEFKADGSVGGVQVLKGLGGGLNDEAVRAAHHTIFLPAVKDGAFADYSKSVTQRFFLHN